ncbi:MAG TPA: ABC transporter substrate-binding protein [Candidatus Limnocylindrales bacterium]|jgi:osmoprotectant transport system substrate-binding protein|nr:ABC transporter substrate-binding protein [Candidatus Limnocylindrales bacterium]
MRTPRVLAAGLTVLVLVAACSTGGGATQSPSSSTGGGASQPASQPASAPASEAAKAPIKIGSDNFYESKLVAEIYAQVLENAGYTVERKFGLGSRQERIPAMDSGQVDLVPEYVGSGLGFYDKSKISGDGQKNADALQEALKAKNITVLAIAPGTDTNAFAVRADTASTMSLSKMSDLAAHQDQLKWGLPSDCDTNPLCAGALKDYGINYPPKQRTALGACDVPMAQALQGKAIDVAEFCSTQPAIAQFGFVVLEDDKQTQPAENLAPLVRDDYLAKVDKDAFSKLLNDASAKITTEELTKMGVEVAVNQKDVSEVAKAFLQAQGLVK